MLLINYCFHKSHMFKDNVFSLHVSQIYLTNYVNNLHIYYMFLWSFIFHSSYKYFFLWVETIATTFWVKYQTLIILQALTCLYKIIAVMLIYTMCVQAKGQPRSQGLLRFQDGSWAQRRPWDTLLPTCILIRLIINIMIMKINQYFFVFFKT